MPPLPSGDATPAGGSILSPSPQPAGPGAPQASEATQAASEPSSVGSTAGTTVATPSLDEMLNVDLRETEIKAFIKVLSERTHTNWLFDPGLAGKVTLLGPGQMTLREALALLRSILEFKDLTVETVGSVSRIVPRNQGRFRNTELRLSSYVAPGESSLAEDKLVTQYVRLKYRNANDIRGILLNFCRDGAAILPYLPTNSLFITDNGTYIHRLMKIVEELDTPDTSKRVVVIPLRYAFAKTILQPLTEIIKQTRDLAVAPGSVPSAPAAPKPETPVPTPAPVGGAPTAAPTILVDDADNQLLVIALPAELESIQAAVRLLDKDPGHVPEIRLLPLRHSDPESVSRLVTDAFKSDPAIGSSVKAFSLIPDKRTGSLMVTTYSPAMMQRVVNLVQKLDIPMITAGAAVRVYKLEYAEAKKVAEVINGLSGSEDEIATSVVGSGSTTGSARASGSPLDIFGRPAGTAPQGQGGTPNAKQTTVIADEATNSLVIVATRQRFDQLTAVVRELDVVRPQVLVEVLIVRIDVDRARHLGLDFNAVNANSENSRPFAIGSTGQLSSLFSTTGVRNGLNLGLLDSGNFDIAAAARGDLSQLTKIGVLINVLSTDSRANNLSAPKLLTGDNQEAKITVGAQVRIPQGSTLNAINTITNFVTEDLGVMLQLTPRITKNDFVAMKIKAQIKNLIPNQAVAGLPVISNSDIETNIAVQNKATIAMGGLIQEEERETVTKIPILGDLPVLGKLFRDTTKSKNKSNLLVFMTPHIIRTSETAAAETQRISPVLRYVEIKESKRANRENAASLLNAMNEAR
jgi:type II secretion system protein D